MKKCGFTLVEALVAVAIFVVLGTLASAMYVQNVKNYKYIKVEKELTDDAQFIIERIEKEFQNSTIDYEEYYNKRVLDDAYGANYSKYGFEFYYNGTINTGQNPALGLGFTEDDWSLASAVCNPYEPGAPSCGGINEDYWMQNEFYLITGDGRFKTIFAVDAGALVYLRMKGVDDDNNGIAEKYYCVSDVNCNLLPLSPSRTEIKKLKFYISPLEDPYRAFAEQNLTVQMQPHVTIYLEVGPADENQGGLNKGKLPHLEIQTTLSSRVYNEVRSYKP